MPIADASRSSLYPQRIVCLTEETTETLYLMEEDWRIVGISGFTVRPPRARHEKPRVSAFTSAKNEQIAALKPDLVLGFSDLQADIAADLIRRGLDVMVFNHRDVTGIFGMIRRLGGLIGCHEKAEALCERLTRGLNVVRESASHFRVRPAVYFEEWDEPLFAGSQWVSQLVEIAGGRDCFSDYAQHSLGKDRIIADATEVIRRAPDVILGSWCGKKFRPENVAARPGWAQIPAVRDGELHEVKSPLILQPGPAALTDGLDRIHQILQSWERRQPRR
jgi:iron complex transport system substrate-binding protein